MAKRKTAASDPDIPPSVSSDQGIQLLQRQIDSAKSYLEKHSLPENEYAAWETLTRNFLVTVFGSSSPNVHRVMDVGKYGSFPLNGSPEWWENHRIESLSKQLRILESLVEFLQTEITIRTPQTPIISTETFGQSVFLVHGHDKATLHEVARFLESLDLQVIILREQPNEGRTIIEKFIDFSDVGFAVILLSPDDKGSQIDAPTESSKPRARQNVILELGFFLGKLGRRRVCALYREGVEIPSDYSGVLFILLDDKGAWRLDLARELKAVGIDVDMNNAI